MKSFAALLLLLPAALTSCAPFVVTDFVQFTPTRGAPVTISFALASESSTTGCSGVSPNPLHQQGNCDDGTFFQFLLNFNLTVSVPGECPPGTSTEVFASGVVPLDCTSDAEGETCMQDSTVQLS